MPQVPTRKPIVAPTTLPPTNYAAMPRTAHSELPGVTAIVVIPYPQRRAVGELRREKNGPELTVRVNALDRALIVEGAKLCGLSIADYMRQCATHMTNALKGRKDANAVDGSTPARVPRKP